MRALNDKLNNEKLTIKDFVSEFDNWLKERWKTKTASDKFSSTLGVMRWEESMGLKDGEPYSDMGELAENELYHYLRGYILGLVLHEMSKGESGALIITDRGIVEYPPKKLKRQPPRKRT